MEISGSLIWMKTMKNRKWLCCEGSYGLQL